MSATSEVLQGSSDVGFLNTRESQSEQAFQLPISQTLQFMTILFKPVIKHQWHHSKFWTNAEMWANWGFLKLYTSSGANLPWILVFLWSCPLPGLVDGHLCGWASFQVPSVDVRVIGLVLIILRFFLFFFLIYVFFCFTNNFEIYYLVIYKEILFRYYICTFVFQLNVLKMILV